MKLLELLEETKSSLKTISSQRAIDRNYFGPVYHGTTQENIQSIKSFGFDINRSKNDPTNGYIDGPYSYVTGNIPAPLHHLGFGIYFTTSLSIAKKYNNSSVKGLMRFYLNIPRLEIINFAAPRTMMKWWIANGYNYDETKDRYKSTINLTKNLKSQYDAVWFKGKTLWSTLDGDQLCVYKTSSIFLVDDTLAKPYDIASKVVFKGPTNRDNLYIPSDPNIKGTIIDKRLIPDRVYDNLGGFFDRNKDKHYFMVTWSKGGTHGGYTERNLKPV